MQEYPIERFIAANLSPTSSQLFHHIHVSMAGVGSIDPLTYEALTKKRVFQTDFQLQLPPTLE